MGEGLESQVSGELAAEVAVEPVRELFLQLEKTLTIRRLYSPHAGPYVEAMQALERKLWRALEGEPFSVTVGADRLLLGEVVLFERPDRDECFFFPLYRDGLRVLSFSPELDADELERLLSAFEAERLRKLTPDEDLVAYLWRCDLDGIRFSAVDGIGDEESDGNDGVAAPAEDYRALVADLVAKIRDPAPAEEGQSYAFVLDADVRLATTDLRYDATTTRRAFSDNPTVFRLGREQASALRAEVAREDEADLLARFVAVLLALAADDGRTVELSSLARVLKQLVSSLWQVGEHGVLVDTLQRLQAAADGTADPAGRAALRELLRGFFTADRMGQLFRLLESSDGVSVAAARQLWDLAGDASWLPLVDFLHGLAESSELGSEVRRYLRTRIAASPDLLRATLEDREPRRVLTALSLLDPRVEGLFTRELLALARHPSEAVRMKAVAAAGRLGGREAQETLWRVLQGDPAHQVRLIAFRLLASTDRDALVAQLSAVVTAPGFEERPVWERRKLGKMVVEAMGEEAAPLIVRWLPRRRLFLGREQLQAAALVVELLRDCGQAGRDLLGGLAAGHGRVARLAAQALAGGSAA
jgi:hypothetical protein